MRTSWRRRALAALVVVFVAGVLQSCSDGKHGGSSGKDRTIIIGEVKGYAPDVAMNALWKHLLEKKGWQVKLKSLQLGAMFAGLSRGDIDAYMNVWLPTTHGAYVKEYKDEFKILPPWNKQAKLGLVVPDYVDIQTLAELDSHQKKFGGQIVGIEAASGQMKLLKKEIMPAYGLDQRFTLTPSSTPAMLGSLRQAMSKKEPIVVVLWQPHWAWSRFNIRFLGDPKHAWPPPEHIHITLSKDFNKSHPRVTKWFKHTKLSSKQLNDLMLSIEDANGNTQKGVSTWLSKPKNEKLVSAWTG